MDVLKLVQNSGWSWTLCKKNAIIIVPDQSAADYLLEQALDLLALSAMKLKGEILIRWGKSPLEVYKVTASMASNNTNKISKSSTQPILSRLSKNTLISEFDLDLNEIYNNPLPVYINQLSDQKVLFANPAALKAQGKKPAEFLGESAAALNDPEELEYRDSLVIREGFINEYQYSALRWYRDPETNFWRRKRMDFCSNFRQINYLGEECRLAIVLEAIDTGKTIGS